MKKVYDTLFKIDSAGKTRVWSMVQDDSRYCTVAGIEGGNLVTSEWTQAVATNVGRANERSNVAQATFEIEAEYEHKLAREYHRTKEAAGGGAHYFKPMLAQKFERFEEGYAQPKLDGIRCIAMASGLFTREGKPIGGAPHIVEALAPLFRGSPGLILDGELYNHDLKDDFNTIVSLVKKQNPSPEAKEKSRALVQYHVYDLPSMAGAWFSDRNRVLGGLVGALALLEPSIHLVETRRVAYADEYDAFHGNWLERGYEGSMFRLDKPYEQKRSKTLLKRKEFVDAEFECLRIEEGLGNWAGVAKRVVCKLPDGREFGAGIRGTRERAATLLHEKHKVVTVKYFAMTPDGVPRFPVAIKFHGAERTL